MEGIEFWRKKVGINNHMISYNLSNVSGPINTACQMRYRKYYNFNL